MNNKPIMVGPIVDAMIARHCDRLNGDRTGAIFYTLGILESVLREAIDVEQSGRPGHRTVAESIQAAAAI